MRRPLFAPTLSQCAWLGALLLAALGCAFYLRYQVIEQAAVGIACEAGSSDWICAVRRNAIALYRPSAFGIVAVAAALLNLLRPSPVLCAVVLVTGGCGLVLYNASLSAIAMALLILSLARRAPEPE
jgi:hypothetical protein